METTASATQYQMLKRSFVSQHSSCSVQAQKWTLCCNRLWHVSKDMDLQLASIKRLFPNFDLFLAESEYDEEMLQLETILPHLFSDQALRVRSGRWRSGEAGFMARLELILKASNHKQRNARFEADLIACWSSMLTSSTTTQRMIFSRKHFARSSRNCTIKESKSTTSS
jgi:hypothetical protein